MVAALVSGRGRAREFRASQNRRNPRAIGRIDDIQVPEGHKVTFAAYAEGVQIYRLERLEVGLRGPAGDAVRR